METAIPTFTNVSFAGKGEGDNPAQEDPQRDAQLVQATETDPSEELSRPVATETVPEPGDAQEAPSQVGVIGKKPKVIISEGETKVKEVTKEVKKGFTGKKLKKPAAKKTSARQTLEEVSSDELIKIFQAQNVAEKGPRLIKRATGYEVLDQYRIGPDVIDDGIECTPLPQWMGKQELPSYAAITKKDSDEIIPSTPKKVDESTTFDIRMYMQTKSPPMSWTASLTTLEEDEFMAETRNVECHKLVHNLKVEIDGEKVYTVKQAKIYKPDGSIEYKPRIRVILTETPTVFNLELEGKVELETAEDIEKIKSNNERYLKMVQHHFESDAYSNRFAQTFENRTRDQWTEYKSPAACDVASQVNSFMIEDEYKVVAETDRKRRLKEEEDERLRLLRDKLRSDRDSLEDELSDEDSDEDDKVSIGGGIDWSKYGGQYEDEEEEEQDATNQVEIDEREFEFSDNNDEFDTIRPLEEIYEELESKTEKTFAKLPDLAMEAVYLDRLMSMEYMQDLQADMRGFPILNASGDYDRKDNKPHFFTRVEDKRGAAQINFGPSIKRYWSLKSHVTKGREVTDIALHPVNGNMIAVAYGSFSFGDDEEGMVCLWSAKNTLYPERVYEMKTAVTCLAFAQLTPYLLAIGLLDGNLLIYDVRSVTPVALSSTLGTGDKHEGPVWQLVWFQETEMATTGLVNEVLLSIGDDGKVNRWTSSKGFDSVTMLRVRKSPLRIPGRREKRADALTSNLSVAYSVCFFPGDWTLYLIGTEEGFIHKCSTSFTEQFLATYIGHSGPVYRIAFNAFDKTIFASASADWSVKVWREGTYTPLLTMQTGLRTVFDVTCSPTMSSVFILASEFHVEVWDLTLNTLEPVVQFAPPFAVSYRRAVYSSYLDSIILGDDEGAITLYGLRDFPKQPSTDKEQIDQLLEGLIPGYKKSAGGSESESLSSDKYFEEETTESSGVPTVQNEDRAGSGSGPAEGEKSTEKGADNFPEKDSIVAASPDDPTSIPAA